MASQVLSTQYIFWLLHAEEMMPKFQFTDQVASLNTKELVPLQPLSCLGTSAQLLKVLFKEEWKDECVHCNPISPQNRTTW